MPVPDGVGLPLVEPKGKAPMRKRLGVLNVIRIALLIPALAADAPALPVAIEAAHPSIATAGRFTEDFRFGWTACNARIRFRGTAVNGVFRLTRGTRSALQVVVDGQPTQTVFVTSDQTVYSLAENLPDGEHTMEIWKRPEGFRGELQLAGFQLNAGAELLPAPRSGRRLLVIGDSISCGYGNEAKAIAEGNTVENQNGYLAYGPIAARALGAEVMVVAWSGRGLFRNRDLQNDREGVLPQLFERTLPMAAEPRWDHARYVPQVIVINLGTNDLFRGREKEKPELTKDDYLGAYRNFLRVLRTYFPEAIVIAAIGPMGDSPIAGWLAELAATEKNVHALIFASREGAEYVGGNWHPSVAMHRIMAEALVEKIRAVAGEAWK